MPHHHRNELRFLSEENDDKTRPSLFHARHHPSSNTLPPKATSIHHTTNSRFYNTNINYLENKTLLALPSRLLQTFVQLFHS
mmetsp:Transcript_27623/g.33575  ORF Transcript_27623/g.33575 Transcript_27623/m.33575 type:complete len:82 (+) Transcript_27623:257-502(+)